MKRKYSKSIIYFQHGKQVEEELTYQKFVNELSLHLLEFTFKYKEIYLDIAYHVDNKNLIYELNMYNVNNDCNTYLHFTNPAELLNACVIEGKTIKEIWDYLEN